MRAISPLFSVHIVSDGKECTNKHRIVLKKIIIIMIQYNNDNHRVSDGKRAHKQTNKQRISFK